MVALRVVSALGYAISLIGWFCVLALGGNPESIFLFAAGVSGIIAIVTNLILLWSLNQQERERVNTENVLQVLDPFLLLCMVWKVLKPRMKQLYVLSMLLGLVNLFGEWWLNFGGFEFLYSGLVILHALPLAYIFSGGVTPRRE